MKAQRTALVVCGLLLMLLGGATATYVGPDDTLIIGSHTVGEAATGQAVRTHPEITDFVNITLLVRAEAPSGVFLGYAHRVDTTSLLEGRRHWSITRMSLGNVGGDMVEDIEPSSAEALRPDRIVGWLDSASGEAVELGVPLDGTPIDVVAVPSAADERVRIALGAKVNNLFLSQLGVIGVGLVLIAFSFVLGWWVRRREARAGQGKAASSAALDGTTDAGAPGDRAGETGGSSLPKLSTTTPSSQPESWEAALAAASAAVHRPTTASAAAVTASTPAAPPATVPATVPEPEGVSEIKAEPEVELEADVATAPAPPPVTTPTHMRMDVPASGRAVPEGNVPDEPDELVEPAPTRRRFKRRFLFLLMVFPLARIVRRRALSRRSLPLLLVPLALFLQSCSVPGPATSADDSLTRTGLSLAEAGQLVDDPVAVYAPEFTTYPMWALIATGDPTRVQLRTRARFTAKWRSRGKVRLAKASEVPDSVSSAIDPGPVLQKRADAAATEIGAWWSTGDAAGVTIDGRTKKERRKLLRSGLPVPAIEVSPTSDDPLARMVEVSGGHLLWITQDLSTSGTRYRLTTVALMETTSEPKVLGSRLKTASRR